MTGALRGPAVPWADCGADTAQAVMESSAGARDLAAGGVP